MAPEMILQMCLPAEEVWVPVEYCDSTETRASDSSGWECDWMAAEDYTSLNSSLSTNTQAPRLLLFHYLLLCIVMLQEFNVVPFIVENEKCHFPLLPLSVSPSPNTNLKCLISLRVFNSLIASVLKKEA